MYTCNTCQKTFSQSCHLRRHEKSHSDEVQWLCSTCGASFQRKDYLTKHEKTHLRKRKLDEFSSHPSASSQPSTSASSLPSTPPAKRQRCSNNSALERNVEIFNISTDDGRQHLDVYLENHKQEILKLVKDAVQERKGVKWYITTHVLFIRNESWIKDDVRETDAYFQSGTYTALPDQDSEPDFHRAVEKLLQSVQTFIRQGSGWIYKCVLDCKVTTATYRPLSASSYIPTPKELENKKAIINVQNIDFKCLLWSVLAYLYPAKKHSDRVTKYIPYEYELNACGIDFPTPLHQVGKFAKQNSLSISVYGFDKKEGLHPLLISNDVCDRHVDLLLISNGGNAHYCYIKKMNRLLNNIRKQKDAIFHCRFCLHRFTRKDLLDDHFEMCRNHTAQKTVFPEPGNNFMKFTNIHKQLPVPFIIFADFESFALKVQGPLPSQVRSSTTHLTQHEPSGFAFVVLGPNGHFFQEPVIYSGPDVVKIFFEKLIDVQGAIMPLLQNEIPLEMNEVDEVNFQNSTTCHICQKIFIDTDIKTRDHDHLTGKYRGAACQTCNLNYKLAKFIPVVFHNLRSYDAHILMQGIGSVEDQHIKCIPNNMEKYVSFSLGSLRFIDSFQFMAASLDSLVNNLVKSGEDKFNCVKCYFPADKLPLLLRKGIFPYDFLDSPRCFDLTELPPKDKFYNQLTQTDISDEDFIHAHNVWNSFGMLNFKEYHDLYMILDVLLLADVFQNFRAVCQQYYQLDPAHYFTCPGLAWDAALLKTGVQLELLTESNMYLFIERGIRGGISMISHRFSQANNPYLDTYDPAKPISYLSYLDKNNLYGTSMLSYLPVSCFKWVENFDLDITNIPDDSDKGYILEVDLLYPEHLHETHSDYPLAPERMKITEDMLSPYSKDLLEKLGMQHFSSIEKLVPNLLHKQNYIVHYRNLKYYLSLGLKLTKIHRVLSFEQKDWLRPYVEFNTEKRKLAKDDFEKDLFKLLNNAVFGKSMEDVRKRIDVHLVQTAKKFKKLVAKPTFKSCKIFTENLVGVEMLKATLKLDKPIYTGFTILDISKLLMYQFHYGHMLPKYGTRLKLNFTDTDSFCYTIETPDVYKDMLADIDLYDTSSYPKDHFLYSAKNNKVLGKFKDEVAGGIVKEFIGLRPKCYSMITTIGDKKTAKGVTKSTTKHELEHEKYRSCLLTPEIVMADMIRIENKDHELFTSAVRKIGLSPADDKRYLIDGISTLAYGHYKIKQL